MSYSTEYTSRRALNDASGVKLPHLDVLFAFKVYGSCGCSFTIHVVGFFYDGKVKHSKT